MSVNIYHWPELEVDFMKSEFLKVKTWARHTPLPIPSPNNPTFKEKTKGWAKKKQEMQEETAREIIRANQKNEIETVVTALEKMKQALVRRVSNSVDELNANDLNKIWAMLRIENGLPITIAKNENRNEDVTREKELEILRGLTQKVLANVSNDTTTNTGQENT